MRAWRRIGGTFGLVLATLATVGPADAAGGVDWMALRTLNIAHQGGENEAPSNTMYAYRRAMRLGADMLEVDIHTTADGEVVVLHDARVDRTTDGSGRVYDMSLEEIQTLDAAHNFVPGEGTRSDRPEAEYRFRGVRTGEREPPLGTGPEHFRIPTLEEVMGAYPTVPINIEIKGAADTDIDSFLRNAELLAGLLNRLGRSDGIIVASFNDLALERFHSLAPQIDLAPATAAVAAYKGARVRPGPGRVAFQVPITFSGVTVTDDEFVRQAHEDGYAVHVWLSIDGEDEEIYGRLIDWNVDGVMAAESGRLESLLCERGVERPERPSSFPGRHCSPRYSIACVVTPVRARRAGRRGKVRVTLERSDEFAGRCAGRVQLKAIGARGRSAVDFDFGKLPPGQGGPAKRTVRLKPTRGARKLIRRGGARARIAARPYGAFVDRARVPIE